MGLFGSKNNNQAINVKDDSIPQHEHAWEVYLKTYSDPRRDVDPTKLSESLLQKALFGFTTLLSKCVICHLSKSDEVLGSETSQLDDLIQKVESYGPTYIQKGGITYMISKFQAPVAQALPLR